ncbi:MAG: hypothetical protein R2883_06175 [Caldisericia bacterium]
MDHKAEYDPMTNIVILSLIGKPKTTEDIDFLIERTRQAYQKIGTKVWSISDITGMAASNPKLIADFGRKNTVLSEQYVIKECVFTNKSLQKLMVQIYNNATKSNVPVFKSKEEALSWIEEQKKAAK